MSKFKTFSDALTAAPSKPKPIAANDNKPRKMSEPRYRGTLPALRWLYDNHPELATAVADAVQSLSNTTWSADAIDNDQEIRPTVGELLSASTDSETGEHLQASIESDTDGNPYVMLGPLKFAGGELIEYGKTKKGRKLTPRDTILSREEAPSKTRNPSLYVFRTSSATLSPMHSESYHRPFSGEQALIPMYAPQAGVEEARAVLVAFGVDGSVPFNELSFPATLCPTVVAKGAEFLGGVVSSSGNSSQGAIMWEAPEVRMGEARQVIEEVAAGATLTEIGERLGLKGGYAIRSAGDALVDAAKAILASNDNIRRKKAA